MRTTNTKTVAAWARIATVAALVLLGCKPAPKNPPPLGQPKQDCDSCNDGQGTGFIFPAAAYRADHREGTLAFALTDLFGKQVQSCACTWAYLQRGDKLVEVSEQDFEAAIATYQRGCDDCLLVQQMGGFAPSEVRRYSTDTPWPPKAAVVAEEQPSKQPEELGTAEVLQVVLGDKAALQECLAEHRAKAPLVHGKLVMRWTVVTSGATRDAAAVDEKAAPAHLVRCFTNLIQRWKFPPHQKQGDPVTFPFKY